MFVLYALKTVFIVPQYRRETECAVCTI